MNYLKFTNMEDGYRGFEFFENEEDAVTAMENDIAYYRSHGVKAEVGVCEVVSFQTSDNEER